MGIPFYFAQLVKKHGASIVRRGGRPPHCEHLCFDYNCLIHGAAGAAVRAGAKDVEGVYAEIRRRTLEIARLVRPTRTVMLCIDGVPPLAKMYQQRKRRYMGVKERAAVKGGGERGWWNPSVVTPGTAFMERLDKEVIEVCDELRAALPGVEVVYSSWREDGEGEHKIFGLLDGNGGSVVIHGLDADMIMLSLLHPELDITLMREDDASGRPLTWVDIGTLRRLVEAETQGGVPDYILMCMLLGNDFLPPVSYMSVINNDVAHLVRRYNEWHSRTGERLTSKEKGADGCHVRFDMLAGFLATLVPDEDERMRAAHDRYFAARVPRLQDRAQDAEHRWKHFPVLNKQDELADMLHRAGWRGQYYSELLGAPVSAVVARYLEGLEWNMRYYIGHRAPDAQWFYEHTHGPTLLDLHNRLVGVGGPARGWDAAYDFGVRVTPEAQLVCVIPPADAAALMPPRLRRVHTDVSLGCVHMFPVDFVVPTYLKALAWECHPLLPPIDLRRIARALEAAA